VGCNTEGHYCTWGTLNEFHWLKAYWTRRMLVCPWVQKVCLQVCLFVWPRTVWCGGWPMLGEARFEFFTGLDWDFRDLTLNLQTIVGIILPLCRESLLPNLLQFVVCQPSYRSTRYSVSYWRHFSSTPNNYNMATRSSIQNHSYNLISYNMRNSITTHNV